MIGNNRSRHEGDISNINLSSNANLSNDEFTREFSFLSKNIEPKIDSEINSAIKHGDHKKYRELIKKDHNATFIQIPEYSLSPLHRAVTCNNKHADEVKKTISAVLQSGIDINHPDKDGNTPLTYLLNEAKERGKKLKDDCISKVEFLMKRGASLHADLYQIIPKEALNKIYEAKQKFQEEAKAKLSKYIEDSDIEDVSIYGNRARIQLKGDKNEFKISEFLQSDFCQKNGISGFSTLHSNGKSGIHGVVSSEGIRHYAVTDGSYEMTLKWYVEGKKCEVVIKIDSDGDVKLVEGNDVTEEQLKANKDVKIGDLFLADALSKGRWKENEEQRERSETVRSTKEIVREVSAPLTPERVESQLVTSTPMTGAKKLNCNLSPIPYAGNYPPLSPEGKTFFERVFNEQNDIPASQKLNVQSDSVLENVAQRRSESQQQQANTHIPEVESQHVTSTSLSYVDQQQADNQLSTHEDPAIIKDGSESAEGRREKVDSTQTKILKPEISLQELVQAGKAEQQHAPQLSVPTVIADDHPQNDSSQLITSRFSFPEIIDDPEPSPRVLKQCEQRKAVREENLEGVYNLQSLFADQNVKSESAEHTAGSQPSTEKEELGLNNLDYPTPTTDYDQSRTHPKQLHAGQGALTPIKEFLSKLDENKKFPLNPIDLSKIGNDRAEDKPELLKIFDQKNLGLKQTNPNEIGNNDSGHSPPTTDRDQFRTHPKQLHVGQNELIPLKEFLSKLDENKKFPLNPVDPSKIGNNRAEDEPELLKKFEQGLKPVNPDDISEQTRKRLSEDGLLKNAQTDAKIVDHSTSSEHSPTILLSNSGSDSGYASPTHTNQGKRQVNPEQPRKNVGQNELTLFEELKNRLSQPTLGLKQINLNRNGNNDSGYSTPTTDRGQSRTHSKQLNVVQGDDLTQLEEFLSKLDENKKFPLNPVDPSKIGNNRVEEKSELLKKFEQGLKPVDLNDISEQTRKRLLEDGLLKDTQTDVKTVESNSIPTTSKQPAESTTSRMEQDFENIELENTIKLQKNPCRSAQEPEAEALNYEKTRKALEKLKKRNEVNFDQPDKQKLEWDNAGDICTKLPPEGNSKCDEEVLEHKQLFNDNKSEAEQDEVNSSVIKTKKPSYSKNFNQRLLSSNTEYYNISSLFDENEQKTAKLNNTQSSPVEQVMSELEEVFKRRNENKESISVPQITEKNILTVNSHNPFLEQISKDIEGGKLKKGTLKNWAERVKEQQKTRDAEISRG